MNPINSTKTVTWSQAYNDFKDALSGAADALKTGSEHVYQVLVQQQVTNSVTNVILYIAFAIVTFFSWKLCNKLYDKHKDESYSEWGMLYIVPTIITVLSLVHLGISMNATVMGFVNPEYGAIQEIKSFIK